MRKLYAAVLALLLVCATVVSVSGMAMPVSAAQTAVAQTKQSDGLQKKNGKLLYFENGKRVRNQLKRITVSGKKATYYFNANGHALQKQWKTVNGKTYYFASSGKAVTGTRWISHYYCRFNSNGVLLRKVDKNKKMLALTYDDGPSDYTAEILSVLQKYNSAATFFVVGERVDWYPKTVKRTISTGSEIGSHTYTHPTLTELSTAAIRSQMQKTQSAVKRLTGTTIRVMRPTGGAYNDKVRAAVQLPLILWSVDTEDWRTRDAAATVRSALAGAEDGAIILMHDLYASTAKATKTIVPKLVQKGYQLVTISELAACRGSLQKGAVYFCY